MPSSREATAPAVHSLIGIGNHNKPYIDDSLITVVHVLPTDRIVLVKFEKKLRKKNVSSGDESRTRIRIDTAATESYQPSYVLTFASERSIVFLKKEKRKGKTAPTKQTPRTNVLVGSDPIDERIRQSALVSVSSAVSLRISCTLNQLTS